MVNYLLAESFPTRLLSPRHANMDFNSRNDKHAIPAALPQRPKNLNTYGKETSVTLNTFNVSKVPNTIVYQYDVAYSGDSNDYTKRKLLQKIWHSKAVEAELGRENLWVWDGHKLAWSVLVLLTSTFANVS